MPELIRARLDLQQYCVHRLSAPKSCATICDFIDPAQPLADPQRVKVVLPEYGGRYVYAGYRLRFFETGGPSGPNPGESNFMKNYRAARFVVVGAMLMFLSIAGASAATFYYDAYGGFVSGTDSPAGSGTFVNDPDTATGGTFDVGANADPRMAAGRFVDVTWGNPSGVLGPYGGKSGFAISKVDNGTVITDGTAVDFGKLTHFNRPIGAGSDLDLVQLDWRLQLFATAIDATNDVNQFQTVDLNFTIYNWETPNSPASNPAYSISTDGGASFHLGPSGVCPGSYAVGTLIVGPWGRSTGRSNSTTSRSTRRGTVSAVMHTSTKATSATTMTSSTQDATTCCSSPAFTMHWAPSRVRSGHARIRLALAR
ncbi:MAG: hypothetical protein IPM02_21315 [Betaproteobacteria bacterium]|nr:hypothetical protein [Betaproteobacteria bacterium]